MTSGPWRAAGQLASGVGRVRPPWALAGFLRSDVMAGRGVPRGDGAPVVVLPPAVIGDWYMGLMTRWLGRIGYQPHGSSISWHMDCSDHTLAKVLPRVLGIAAVSGRPVSLVGHSRGGLLAKAIAQAEPTAVHRVVTLGAPLTAPFELTNVTLARVATVARGRFQRDAARREFGCLTTDCRCPYGEAYRRDWPAGPRLVSLFTRSDEVVPWQSCVVPYAHNIELAGSHMGMNASSDSYVAVARALAGEYDEPGTTWRLG